MDFNNVILKAGNKKISIAQHWVGSTSLTQEIGIIHENKDIDIISDHHFIEPNRE